MALIHATSRPSQIYYGGIVFYLAKLGLSIFGIAFLLAGMASFGLGIVATWQAGNYTVETAGMLVILFIGLGNFSLISIVFLHMHPEIGISETHLWFRQVGVWRSIAWSEIGAIRSARTLFTTQGVVVYSNKLPIHYLFFGRAYGRRGGRALFIPSQIAGFDELKRNLQLYSKLPIQGSASPMLT